MKFKKKELQALLDAIEGSSSEHLGRIRSKVSEELLKRHYGKEGYGILMAYFKAMDLDPRVYSFYDVINEWRLFPSVAEYCEEFEDGDEPRILEQEEGAKILSLPSGNAFIKHI